MAGTIPAPRRRGHGAGRRRLAENRTPDGRPWTENGDVPSVLIVDDHAGFRTRARRLLEAEGWQVVGEAAAAAQAGKAPPAPQPDAPPPPRGGRPPPSCSRTSCSSTSTCPTATA